MIIIALIFCALIASFVGALFVCLCIWIGTLKAGAIIIIGFGVITALATFRRS